MGRKGPASSAVPFSPHPPGTDWQLPVPLGPVYPPLVSSLSSVKALGRSWELTPPTANRFRIHSVSLPRVRFFLHPLQAAQRERAPSRAELSRVLRPMQTRGAGAGGVYPSPTSLSSPGTWGDQGRGEREPRMQVLMPPAGPSPGIPTKRKAKPSKQGSLLMGLKVPSTSGLPCSSPTHGYQREDAGRQRETGSRDGHSRCHTRGR